MEFEWNPPRKKLGILIEDIVTRASSNKELDYYDIIFVNKKDRSTSVSLKVAGYDVSDIYLYFAVVPNIEDQIDFDIKNTSLYMACYKILPEEYEIAVEDLLGKLSGIYGNASTVDLGDGCSSMLNHYYKWKGDNSTFVYLTGARGAFDSVIKIYYGTTQGDSLVRIAEGKQKSAERKRLKEEKDAELERLKKEGTDGL